jgi:hypothetical protein
LLALDAGEHSRPLGAYLEVHFVSLKLNHHVPYTDGVALLLEPTAHRGLNHRLAQLGYDDLRRHKASIFGVR